MSFVDITVVGITGADSYTEGTMYAVARSCPNCLEAADC